MEIFAGIVTYNPDFDRLKKSLEVLVARKNSGLVHIAQIVVVDNGTEDIRTLRNVCSIDLCIVLIENGENLGIAAALDRMCGYSYEQDCKWLLTLDDDSVISENLPELYMQALDNAGDSSVAMVCGLVNEAHYGNMYYNPDCKETYQFVEHTITSGSLMNLEIWKKVGGFDDSLFIDGVDFDYCLNLKKHGYRILRNNQAVLHHELGNGRPVNFMGRKVIVLNHSPQRLYYIARNYWYLGAKYNMKKYWHRAVFNRMLLVLLYEKNRLSKLRAMFLGISHSKKHIFGKQMVK